MAKTIGFTEKKKNIEHCGKRKECWLRPNFVFTVFLTAVIFDLCKFKALADCKVQMAKSKAFIFYRENSIEGRGEDANFLPFL